MFRPAQHSVADVLAYLATVADDTIEVGRVLAAERTGLARPEILAEFRTEQGGRTPV